MNVRRTSWIVMAATALLALAVPSPAVIKLDITVSKVYETSKSVLAGTVSSVDASTRVIEVTLGEAFKGENPGPRLRIQIAAPQEFIRDVANGQPIVLFIGRGKEGMAAVHLADTWLLANAIPNTNLQVWRVVQLYDAVKQSFPGRTAALVRLVTELKTGNRPIIDRWERKIFGGGVRERTKLNVSKPVWLAAARIDGDPKPDLLVGSAAGTRLFIAKDAAYEDATDRWASWGSSGGYHAVGDANGDGRTDVLLDETLWLNDGNKFKAVAGRLDIPRNARPLAASLVDANGDGKLDAALLTADGQLRVFDNPGATDRAWPLRFDTSLWKGGPPPVAAAFGDWGDNRKLHVLVVSEAGVTRYPIDPDGGRPGDMERLTGFNVRKNPRYKDGFKNMRAATLDMDGDGRRDLFAVCDTGGLLLINRGYGAFLLDDDAAKPLASHADRVMKPTPAALWTSADLHGHGCDDLLILAEDGTLYELDNGPR